MSTARNGDLWEFAKSMKQVRARAPSRYLWASPRSLSLDLPLLRLIRWSSRSIIGRAIHTYSSTRYARSWPWPLDRAHAVRVQEPFTDEFKT